MTAVLLFGAMFLALFVLGWLLWPERGRQWNAWAAFVASAAGTVMFIVSGGIR